MMLYIFLYNVIYIKSNFSKLLLPNEHHMVLIGSEYCLRELSVENRWCFDAVHEVSRDFHEVDQQEVEEIVEHYLAKYHAKNIRLLTNEDSAQLVCARVREKYNIPGPEVNALLPFVNKVISKERLDNAIKTYKFIQFDKEHYAKNKGIYLNSIIAKLGFPMFAKPIDLVSSVETHYIADENALRMISERILHHEYEFEIDEFIDGELFHCDAMIIKGEVEFFMVGKCSFALARFFEGKPVGSIPIIDQSLFGKLREFCEITFNKLKCHDGAYHMEIFLSRTNQELIFLEIGARTGGALITRVYEKLFGINIEQVNYSIQMGLIDHVKTDKKNIFAGFLNFPKIEGTVDAVKPPKLDIAHEFIEYVIPGDNLEQAKNLLDMSCSIIFWDDSYEKVENAFEFLKNYAPLKVKKMPVSFENTASLQLVEMNPTKNARLVASSSRDGIPREKSIVDPHIRTPV